MSNHSQIRKVFLIDGESPVFVSRVENANGTPVTSSDVVSFVVYVFDHADSDSSAYSTDPLDGSLGYLDALAYGYSNLLGDDGGYNFKYVIEYSEFHFRGAKTYRVEIVTQFGSELHKSLYDVIVSESYS